MEKSPAVKLLGEVRCLNAKFPFPLVEARQVEALKNALPDAPNDTALSFGDAAGLPLPLATDDTGGGTIDFDR